MSSTLGYRTGAKGELSSGKLSKYLVKEHFNQANPSGWDEIGEIVTYDPVNKDIDVRAHAGLDTHRYSKNFLELTQNDSFAWMFKIELDSYSSLYTRAKCGCFRKDHWNTYHSISIDYELMDVALVIYPTLWIRVRSYKGIAYETRIGEWGTFWYDIDYKVRAWYDAVLRKITAKVYEGDTLKATKSYVIPEGVTFTVNTFGVGNRRIDLDPTKETRCKYDDAILTIPGSRSITKSLIASTKNKGTIKGGKVSGSISYK